MLVTALQTITHQARKPHVEVAPGFLCRHDGSLSLDVIAGLTDRVLRVRLDAEAQRVALVSSSGTESRATVVAILDASTGRSIVSRRFDDRSVYAVVPSRDVVAIGRYVQPWTPAHGPKVELRTPDLETVLHALDVDDAGFDVAMAGGVVVATCIDLHVWWPGSARAPWSLHRSRHAPPGEVNNCAISVDGRRVAIIHDRRGESEDAALILDLEDLDAPPARIRPPGHKQAVGLALSPGGALLALLLDTTDVVLVYRTSDGTQFAELAAPRPRACAWLDDVTLAVGGPTLALWRAG